MHKWGVRFLIVNKICFTFVLLLLCVCVHNWSVSQWYMSSKSGAAAEILFFESEKRHGIQPLKTDTLTVSAFDALLLLFTVSAFDALLLLL